MGPVFAVWWLAGCTPHRAPEAPVPSATVRTDASRGIQDAALAALLEEHWEATMAHSPTWATDLGDHRFDDRVPDASLEASDAWRARGAGWLARLAAMDGLTGADAVARDLLASELRDGQAKAACRFEVWSFSPRRNPLLEVNDLGDHHPVVTPEDGANLIRRVTAMADQVRVSGENLREGLKTGRVANRVSTEKVIAQVRAQLAQPLEDWPLLMPLAAPHDAWSEEQLAGFRTDLRAAAEPLRDALEAWVGVLETDVLPAARTDAVGLTGIPDGEACYGALIQEHTTLPLTADALHQTGLDEIARLHGELAMLGKRAAGKSDVAELIAWLRTDPSLRFETSDQVEAKAQEALDRAKAAIPAWFGTLPQADCEVARIPDYQAPFTTIAYYMPVVPGEKPGYYYVNTYAPETRTRHEAEVLAFHESIPGHHLQIAIGQEAGDIPTFRRHFGATAFVEGWALYSEALAEEMGLYSGDTDRFGAISFQLWRASRLVVDTGVHAKGWSREQAERYMLENTPLAENNIVNEVDRYITTPGQALAYKTGQLEILRLRRDAEARLGDRFDIKAFHDTVLGSGAVTLPVLGQRVEAWVSAVEGG